MKNRHCRSKSQPSARNSDFNHELAGSADRTWQIVAAVLAGGDEVCNDALKIVPALTRQRPRLSTRCAPGLSSAAPGPAADESLWTTAHGAGWTSLHSSPIRPNAPRVSPAMSDLSARTSAEADPGPDSHCGEA